MFVVTVSVINDCFRNFTQFRFHFLRYDRKVFLDLAMDTPQQLYKHTDFVSEFLFSMANLYIASEADGFVGTLSSNWCAMIHHLERTRGDAGTDYYSLDHGSAFTSCF